VALEPDFAALVAAADRGDSAAHEALFSRLYAELHGMAKRALLRNGAPLPVSCTTLLHETYLAIVSRDTDAPLDEGRFMAYASRVMRGLLIDHVRRGLAQKRGGRFEITSLKTDVGAQPIDDRDLASLSDALDELACVDPELAEVVDLKFFAGLSFMEIAAIRNVSERTVQRSWDKARIYLHQSLRAVNSTEG
jgi:RNA polymerase sigma factor (TIGR02999 family)